MKVFGTAASHANKQQRESGEPKNAPELPIGRFLKSKSLGGNRVIFIVRPQKIMAIEEFAHMWDGSDDGWTLHYFDRKVWRITVRFPEGRPSIHDVSKLRQLDDDLRNVPASSLWTQLRDVASYSLASELSYIDIHAKMQMGIELGLHCECECIDRSGYLAVHVNGSAMIIEDDDEAIQVTQRMLDAGVPVVETHID